LPAASAAPGVAGSGIASADTSSSVNPGAEVGDRPSADKSPQPWHGRVELKRQNTSRGTADESTRTTLRLESFHQGTVRLLRFDLQFPDAKSTFSGDPFNPRLGDTKVRAGFRPLRSGALTFPSFIELTLPTADGDAFGSGKYQLSAGLRMLAPVVLPIARPEPHETRFEVELQQVNSIGGDADRADINYTKLELSLYDLWRKTWSMKLKLKPSVDWIMDGQTGAVGEIEGGLNFARHWRGTLMLGRRLWGPEGIGGTYDDRLEMTISRMF
jgi:hypothetical protein